MWFRENRRLLLLAACTLALAAEARPEWCTRLWALIANAGPPGRMDWLLNRTDNGGHRDIVTLPPDIRETITQLIAAQQGRPLTDPEHARLANQIVEYLASRGVRAYAERRGSGPDYDITLHVPFRRAALDQAQHFAVRMAKAFKDHWHPDMRLGFNTRNLLNELSGRPGSGGFNEAGARVDLTVQDLFGHRLFTPKGGHEARHVARAFRRSRGPQFALEGHRFAEGAEAGSMYARFLATEEISDTYPYSIRTWLRIQRNLLREADRLEATAPALATSLRDQARHGLSATLFYAKLFAQMYDAATPVFDRIASTPDLAVRAVEETAHNYDRAIVLPTGERLLFKSDQIREWARGRGLTATGDPSLDVAFVRRALQEERDRIEQRGQALGPELEAAMTN